ncbi:hypothetical protein HOLleu_33913 [Holothuria leucospilota]|uniref:Uncharacterized protein n=1 Tax=Holothuria leucospilota TaxID=206669 RepID=A0A9Q0YPI4_HOLLE|nr:hypothetical protein HOLleu_33913 [Holothuria leucospilota]
MEKFRKQDEIQALDTLGRWEPARILKENEDGTFEVGFLGWGSECNTTVPKESVRAAIHPFYQEIGTIRSRERRATPRESSYLSLLRQLVAGAVVDFNLDNQIVAAEVCVVDRFTRTVTADINGVKRVIHASKIRVPSPPTVVKTRTVTTKKRKNGDALSRRSLGADTSCCPSDTISQSDTLGSDQNRFLRVLTNNGDVFTTGDSAKLMLCGNPVSMGITGLFADSGSQQKKLVAGGFLFGDTDVKVQVPFERLEKASTGILPTISERKLMKTAFKEALQHSLKRSKIDFHYRVQVRRTQIGRHLRNEIRAALKSKLNCRMVSLGVSSLDTDLEILGIDPLKQDTSEFSYKKGNLASLDLLMGDRWDVELQDGRTSFVTSVVFKVNNKDVVIAKVSTAYSWIDALATDHYRRDLRESCTM